MIYLVLILYAIIAYQTWSNSHECSVFCSSDGEDTGLWWLFDLLSGLLWPVTFLFLLTASVYDRIKR